MQKAGAFFLIALLGIGGGFLFAQEEEAPDDVYPEETPGEDVPIESDWGDYMPALYSAGDQTFTISLGVIFPTIFTDKSGLITHNITPVGGTGFLGYSYFLDSHFSLGGEIGGMFIATLAKNTLFIIPIGLKVGYQFILGRFELPLGITIGFAPQRYLEKGYFGFFLKPIVGGFFRFNPDWSFGINTAWWWVPQWPKESEKYINGNFIDITLSARYHF
ncbi:MAG: hypothetical protein LBN21_01730 [Treponema sp.]|jgi:hypothetical protein|nr:hypothetical protein [Treponema sp.]